MKICRLFFVATFMLFTFLGTAQQPSVMQNYALLNPAVALPKAESALSGALKSGDSKAVMIAYLDIAVCKALVSTDSIPTIITLGESLQTQMAPSVAKSVMQYVVAEMYVSYYNHNAWKINNRKQIDGANSDDITVWGANQFHSKIIECYDAIMSNAKQLEATPIAKWQMLVSPISGPEEPARPMMFDVLAYGMIDNLLGMRTYNESQPNLLVADSARQLFSPVEEFVKIDDFKMSKMIFSSYIFKIYQQLLKFHIDRPTSPQSVMADFGRLDFALSLFRDFAAVRSYYSQATLALGSLDKGSPYLANAVYSRMALLKIRQADSYHAQSDRGAKLACLKSARSFCLDVIKKFPNSPQIASTKVLYEQLTRETLDCEVPIAYPNDSIKVNLRSTNVTNIKLELFLVDSTAMQMNRVSGDELASCCKNIVASRLVNIPVNKSILGVSASYSIMAQKCGIYVLKTTVKGSEKSIYNKVYVTAFATASRSMNINGKEHREILVTDSKSGRPIKGAVAKVYDNKNVETTVSSDMLGIIRIDSNKGIRYHISKDADIYSPLQTFSYSNSWSDRKPAESINIYTDRVLYRPGQKVCFSGIVSEIVNVDDCHSVSGRKVQVKLTKGGDEIQNILLVSDEFGSFSGEFILPEDAALGNYNIEANDTYANYISVAEYKRPTFKIDLDNSVDNAQFGKPLTLTGRVVSYSGATLDGAKVVYDVNASNHNYFKRWFNESLVNGDSTTTNDKGEFSITITPTLSSVDAKQKNVVCNYRYFVRVTDANGETQTAVVTVVVGQIPLILTLSLPDTNNGAVERGKQLKIDVKSVNQSDRSVDASGQVKIYLQGDVNKTVLYQTRLDSGNVVRMLDISSLPSGAYRASVSMTIPSGYTATQTTDFIVWSYEDTRLARPMTLWSPQSTITVEKGAQTRIYIGSTTKEAYVLYEAFVNGRKIECRRVTLNSGKSGNVHIFDFVYDAKWNEDASLQFTYIKNGAIVVKNITVSPVRPNRILTVKATSFRDKITPGSVEKWSFTISDASNAPVYARIFATMFDNALNAIQPHRWAFEPWSGLRQRQYVGWSLSNTPYNRSYYESPATVNVPTVLYPMIYIPNPFSVIRSLVYNGEGITVGVANKSTMIGAIMRTPSVSEDKAVIKGSRTDDGVPSSTAPAQKLDSQQEFSQPIDFRSDFSETAFFYPKLRTDMKGVVTFEFEVPQSNTEWKLMMLAYTNKMKSGTFDRIVVGTKPVLVRANMPRFLRNGDAGHISFSVSNLTESDAQGSAVFEIFNLGDNTTILKQDRPFSLKAGQSEALDFSFETPQGIEVLGVRVGAATANHTDGEQHSIAVLPARTLVTQTTNLNQIANTGSVVEIASLKNTSATKQDFALTVEVMANPLWSVVEALPALMQSKSQCISWVAASLYANAAAYKIARSNPNIEKAITELAKSSKSPLEKNQELKVVEIEQSPWASLAKSDSERIGNLRETLSKSRAQLQVKRDLNKVFELQNENGGWGWYKGFPSSMFITINILEELARIDKMDVYDGDIKKMSQNRQKALNYVNNAFSKDSTVSYMTLLYLHMRSSYNEPENPEIKRLINIAEKNWRTMTLYERALTAIILSRSGRHAQAMPIIESLRGMATQTATEGMWWQNNRNSHSLFSNNSVLCQVAIIGAFREVDPHADELQKMTAWLISQKQVQKWESVPSTVDAIESILDGQQSPLSQGTTTVEWGDMKFKLDTSKPLSSYMKKSVMASEITADLDRISIQKQGSAPLWGALYHQYYEDYTNIKASATGVSLSKELLVEHNVNGIREYLPIDKAALRVGDKVVVRLVVRSDRDMDYVVLNDARAACMEPVEQTQQVRYQEGVGYVAENRDASTTFYINYLPKGTFVLTYDLWVDRAGTYTNGSATLQSIYAPQFTATTPGSKITVD